MANETNRTISIYLNNSPAIKKLNELEAAFNKEKKSLRGLKEGSKEWIDQLTKLDGAAKELVNFRTKLDITGLSLKQLNNEAKNLRAMRDNLAPGTKELKLLNQQLEEVEKRTFAIRGQKNTGMWGSVKNIAIGSGIGNITGNMAQNVFNEAMAIIPNAIKKNAALADSYADVMRYTGLTRKEVELLSSDFKGFDTRSPREELLKLAGEAGKLNITGAANIRNFVKEADQIRVALGEDLGDDAIVMIAKLNNLWGTDKVYGYAQALTKAGSAINSLGQAGVATESYIVDATGRLGGMAAQAGITQTNVMGLAATMEELAITSELGTTAINMLWSDLYKNTANYAKIANMNVKEFAKLLKDDANEAFLKVLQGLGGTNTGLEHLVKNLQQSGIDGSRATAVFAALSKNVNLVREKQALANTEFTKGTSIASEFDTKNKNLAGSWEKIGKVMSSWYTNGLLSKAVNGVVFGLEKLLITNKKVSDGIQDQIFELTRYRMKINDVNIKESDRIKLITELKQIYPQLLKDIDAQTSSNEQLNKAIGKVNNSLLAQMLIQKNKESFDSEYTDAVDTIDSFAQYQSKMSDELTQLLGKDLSLIQKSWNTRANGAAMLTKDAIADMRTNINRMIDEGQNIGVVLQAAIATPSLNNTALQRQLKGWLTFYYQKQTAALNAESKTKDIQAKQEKYKKQIQDFLKVDLSTAAPEMAAPGGGSVGDGLELPTTPDAAKKEKTAKEYDLLLKQYTDLNQRLLDTKIDYRLRLESEDDRELQDLRDKYDAMEDSNVEMWNKLQADRDDALANEKAALLDHNTKLAKSYRDQAINLQDQMLVVNDQMVKIAYQRDEDLTRKKQEQADKRVRIAKEEADKDAQARKEAEERIFLATGKSLSIELYQMNKHYDELIALAKKYGMSTVAIEESRSNALGKIMRNQLADAINIADQMMGQLNSMIGNINQAMANTDAADLARYKKNQDERKKKLDSRLEIGFLTQQQYDAEVTALNEETAKKESQIKQDAFKREQTAAIIQAIINTALGVTRAYATMVDPISGSIMAGLIAATGAAQVAAIASQPVPEYGKGGYLLSDDLPSHAQGGLAVVDNNGKKVAEMEGGEGIIPKAYAKKYRGLVDRMIRGENIGMANGRTMPLRMNPNMMGEVANNANQRHADTANGAQLTAQLAATTKAIEKLTANYTNQSMGGSTLPNSAVKFVYTDWLRESNKFERIKDVTTLAYSKTK